MYSPAAPAVDAAVKANMPLFDAATGALTAIAKGIIAHTKVTPEQFAAQIAGEYAVYKGVVATQKLKLE